MAVSKAQTGAEIKKAADSKKVKKAVAVGVDKSYADVLQLQSEGYDLSFVDNPEFFLELPSEVLDQLTPHNTKCYRMAENIAKGIDVVGAAVDAVRGYTTDYQIREGSASAQLQVEGKKAGWKYEFFRAESDVFARDQGYVPDHDPTTNTRHSKDEAGTLKTVGGQKSPEMVLYKIPEKVLKERKAKRKDIRMGRLKKSQDTARDTILRAGAKILE